MPLNKLENFIKNAEGRILYVNPNDLDSTDGIENQGNSLTKPFKTIQRALLESARFSYLRGDDNDLVEKTTILVFPGEHLIDNRPGYTIRDNGSGNAIAGSPGGATSSAQDELTLTLNSNFDLTQEDNILYKFNSVYGGIVIPRGTSIVGLDLRKTKIRPKYVPNPTDLNAPNSAIFRITGACYFWQFTFFDGDDTGLVYTDPSDFSTKNKSKPTFSHHKLTCFEYADGVNLVGGYELTDLDMYYSKVSNAFNRASGREIDQKYPATPEGFSKQRPEWEIVGAFATDPVAIVSIKSGDGSTPNSIVTVDTQINHNLNSGTPIRIRGVSESDYNISAKVVQVISETTFTYALPAVRANLPAGTPAGLQFGDATVTIETDTVSGASPYIFNVSLRSVYGMQGMHADGSKADGFRSMVVAQFTAVSLQKDDRAFTKYFTADRKYDQGQPVLSTGEELSQKSNSPNVEKIYHLDSDAVYREGWQSSHIKMSNDSVIQVVSVFAIGFHKHFECNSGGDASITNSNSNFGQFSLAADGFKKDAFTKDDKGFVTSIIPPKSIAGSDIDIEWVQIDLTKTNHILGRSSPDVPSAQNRIYLLGYDKLDVPPPIISQGYRVGAKVDEEVFLSDGTTNHGAKILMSDDVFDSSTNTITGTVSSAKVYRDVFINTGVTQDGASTVFNTTSAHKLKNGESIRIFSEIGDLPDGLENKKVYYAITQEKNTGRSDNITLGNTQLQLASSKTNAEAQTPIYITSYPNDKATSALLQLRIESRVSDKKAGELGHPIQFDTKLHGGYNNASGSAVPDAAGGWFVLTPDGSDLLTHVKSIATSATDAVDDSEITFVKRKADDRSLDEKLYRIRYVIPKEFDNTRDPVSGFVLQDSSTVNVRETADHVKTSITRSDYDFDRNTRFISNCTYDAGGISKIGGPGFNIRSDKPHNLQVGDVVIITGVKDTTNTTGIENSGFNGEFIVGHVVNDKKFQVSNKDVFGTVHAPGATFTNDVNTRNTTLPTFKRNNNQKNLYIYRVETITNYINNIQDGVFYLYVINCNNSIQSEFTVDKFSQNVTNLYPQEDRDNFNDNPPAANSYAKRTPIGEVVTDDLKRSITRETVDVFYDTFDLGHKITSASVSNTSATLTFSNDHQLGAVRTVTGLNGGSSHTEGTYYNVKLLNSGTINWHGATAKVVVDSSQTVTSVDVIEGGSGYNSTEILDIDTRTAEGGIGGSVNANVSTQTSGISSATADYVQITGISTVTDAYYRITTVNEKNEIGIARTSGDPGIFANHYAVVVGRVGIVNGTPTALNNVLTVTTTEGHGLVAGNQIRFTDTNNNNKGDFLVSDVPTSTSFTVDTELASTLASSVKYVMKHGMSANNASADSFGENIGTRSLPDYDHEVLFLGEDITNQEQFEVSLPSGLSDIISRFPLGSYVQVGNEIMRVKSTTLPNGNELQVIRGAMGTIIEPHANGAQIKKIKLAPIELRRPSILRASGHTFEYLGYGPGNYSTGLPQVQVKTLTEDEEFLSQSQETSCGTVLYTGMDSDGDFYIGNTKYSAQSGEQKTFDVPTPTVTGEDPNRLSVVFDEVIVKERILIEGGKSKQILSQFDGPITFNGDVRMNKKFVLNNDLRVSSTGRVDFQNTTDANSCDDANAALRVKGGVAIGKKLYVCGKGYFGNGLKIDQNGVEIAGGNLQVDEQTFLRGQVKVSNNLLITSDNKIKFGDSNEFVIYRDPSNPRTYFKDAENGAQIFLTNQFQVKNKDESSDLITANNGGSVALYDSGTKRIETTGSGAEIFGKLKVGDIESSGDLDVDGTAKFAGNTVQITSDTVNANNFTGTADKAVELEIYASARSTGTDEKALLMVDTLESEIPGASDTGTFTKVRRDLQIRFKNSESKLIVTGDIVAFASDDRLKTNKVGISNALEKVNALSGFTYNWTEWAGQQGGQFNPTKRFVGVSAQEVEKVLPEAVAPAPFNDEYLTVQYEKIVPLLIEAIKELSDKVSNLEERLNN